ncbi:MAG: hypothetical protein CO161_05230 [Candidatus Portnoybacteria bacterium CG_4_9_14_3_um_filter_44_9]|nr:MAG: hypothetical protein CO161_05230 [Candidatus Portnoybacteria bacterium CG_4_9_14_3_um_filter_44_9]
MPEKNPSNERMLGKMPENEKQAVLREMLEEFAGKDFELKILRGLAREKTPDEMKIIDLVNERSNEVLAKYELPESIVPPDNFCVINKDDWRLGDKDAISLPALQTIAMRDFGSNTGFAAVGLHELFHFKSLNTLQMAIGEGEMPSVYRAGLIVANRFTEEEYFKNK